MGQYAKHLFSFNQELVNRKPRYELFPSHIAVPHVIISHMRGPQQQNKFDSFRKMIGGKFSIECSNSTRLQ